MLIVMSLVDTLVKVKIGNDKLGTVFAGKTPFAERERSH